MCEKIVFFDRDGVINKDPFGWTEHSYVTNRDDFIFLPKVREQFKRLKDHGYSVVVVSNQQGVGKGYFSERDLEDVTEKMRSEIETAGGRIKKVYYCIHAKEENCNCRKPKDGMFLRAKKELGIKDLTGMVYVGDTERDIIAGRNAGLRTILVLSGKTSSHDAEKWGDKPDHICKDIEEAVDLILKQF